MRRAILGAILALTIAFGSLGTAVAVTPETTATTVRQASITLDSDTEGASDLSNMPEIHDSDTSNE
jgi:hypothetical protein